MKKILFLLIALACGLAVNAETIKAKIPLNPPREIPSGRPLSPAKEIIRCYLTDEGNVIISSEYDSDIYAEVRFSESEIVVAAYSSANPSSTHKFYIEPQNTTLTIEIEVDGKTYAGEFFY